MINVESARLYKFKEGDKVTVRKDAVELIKTEQISPRGGWVNDHMESLIGKELIVKKQFNNINSFNGRDGIGYYVEGCSENYIYNSEWLVPYEVSGLEKIKQESKII